MKCISIIVLSYNHEKYIRDCLMSILQQSYNNIELIIIDNGSSDGTVNVIDEILPHLINKYENVSFVKNEYNLGITKGFNQGIKKCKGDYIKLLASDDALTEDGLDILTNLVENSTADIFVTNGYQVPENFQYSLKSEYKFDLIYNQNLALEKNDIYKMLLRNNISAPSVLFNRDTFNFFGYFDENMAFEDWEYWVRILSEGGRMSFYEVKLVYCRKSIESTSNYSIDSKNREKKFRLYLNETMRLYEKYRDKLNENEYTKLLSNKFNNLFLTSIKQDMLEESRFILQLAQDNNVKIDTRNWLRYILAKLHLYKLQSKIRAYTK